MRYHLITFCLLFLSVFIRAEDTKKEQEYLFVALWTPNIQTDEVNKFVIEGFSSFSFALRDSASWQNVCSPWRGRVPYRP